VCEEDEEEGWEWEWERTVKIETKALPNNSFVEGQKASMER